MVIEIRDQVLINLPFEWKAWPFKLCSSMKVLVGNKSPTPGAILDICRDLEFLLR